MVSPHQSKQPRRLLPWVLVLILLVFATQAGSAAIQHPAVAGTPGVVSYQGQVTVGGQPYNGTGYFKFAVVDAAGTISYWSNDGTATGGNAPTTGVALNVQRGLFTVLLGDTTLSGMTQPLSAETFNGGATSGERYLRVWFSADNNSYSQLSPDQRIAAVPYALAAQEAVSASNADQLDGQHAAAFALSSHQHDAVYVNDGKGEVDNEDIPEGALNPDRIKGIAWTENNDGKGSRLDADNLDGLDSTAFATTTHMHDPAYVNNDANEVGNLDVPVGGLSPDRISGTAWTGSNDGSGSGLDADLLDGLDSAALRVPQGTVVLGVPGNFYLEEAGYQRLGLSNVTCIYCDGFKGNWSAMPPPRTSPPAARYWHTAVWTGTEMIVWGGHSNNGYDWYDGGRYNPANHTWTPLPTTGAPQGRYDHTAVWTGTEMIVWGGWNGSSYTNTGNTGGRYNPVTNTWTPLPTTDYTGVPLARRYRHTAVWTGTEMIVWGGQGDGQPNTVYRYNPATNTWKALSTTGAPSARYDHTAVWTGTEMIVWGGRGGTSFLNTGGHYNPVTDTWVSLPVVGAPTERYNHTAVWTGTEMIVWGGGYDSSSQRGDGGRYNLAANTWTPLPTTDATGVPLAPRFRHTAVWTGTEMIVWGGIGYGTGESPGWRYAPATDTWTSLPIHGARERSDHTAVWTGLEMIVWGGSVIDIGSLNTIERYTLLLSLYQKQ